MRRRRHLWPAKRCEVLQRSWRRSASGWRGSRRRSLPGTRRTRPAAGSPPCPGSARLRLLPSSLPSAMRPTSAPPGISPPGSASCRSRTAPAASPGRAGSPAKEPISLETPIGDEEDSHLGDFIEDKAAVIPLDAAIQSNLREATTRVLSSLTPREERVLRMRFGIGMNTDHTLEEVGQQFNVTRERIRQIEAKALRKLKHPSRSRKLRSFLDD